MFEPPRGASLTFVWQILGEEVFLDYGIEWEEAWQKHIQSYKPPKPVEGWVTAKAANEKDKILPEFVAGDLRATVDHPYLFTACLYHPSSDDNHRYYQGERYSIDDWKDFTDEKILRVFSDSGAHVMYADKHGHAGAGYSRHRDKTHWPCSVLKEEGPGTDASGQPTTLYTVRIHQSPFQSRTAWGRSGLPRILTSYPRSTIHYIVKPNAGDQFLPGAFRHPLGIPDDIFPNHWKNLAVQEG